MPSDREAFELRLIQDEAFSQASEAEEFDLIEDYAAGLLPREERKQLEKKIRTSPELQARVLIARQLHRSSKITRTGSRGWSWWIAGVAIACVIMVAILHSSRHAVLIPDNPHLAIADSHTPPIQTESILLAAERQRDNALPKSPAVYKVHSSSLIRLQIMLPAATRQSIYSMRLASDHGSAGAAMYFKAIKSQGATDAPYLEVLLPAGSLHSALYAIQLNSSSGSYDLAFRVEVR